MIKGFEDFLDFDWQVKSGEFLNPLIMVQTKISWPLNRTQLSLK